MNMKKKSKKVKKYAVGGDLRRLPPVIEPGGFGGFLGGGSGGDDGSATGQVKAISKAAGRAGDYLSTAGKAIGSGSGTSSVPFRPGMTLSPYPISDGPEPQLSDGLNKGGSVKKKPVKKNMGGMMKYKKGGKVRGVGRAVQKKIRPAKMVKM
jgi:hypothetical protein